MAKSRRKKKKKRFGPSAESMMTGVEHTYEHRGQTGKFGDYFTEDIVKYKVSEDEHEFMVVPYQIEDAGDSLFRVNTALNKPFTEEEIEDGNCWDWKLSVLVHGGMGPNKDRVICPSTIKEACPICEFVDTLDEDDDEDLIRSLYPYKRGLINLISFDSRKEKKKGVQVWEAPHKTVVDVIATKARDKRTGKFRNFALPTKNLNVCYERKGTGMTTTEYLDVTIEKRTKKHRFSDGELEEIMEQAHNFEEIVEIKDYDELEELVAIYKDDDEDEPKKSKKKKKKKKRDEDDEDYSYEDDDDEEDEEDDEECDDCGEDPCECDDDEDDEEEEEELPQCFGIKCGKLSKCDDCDEDLWTDCFKESERRKKKKKKKKR